MAPSVMVVAGRQRFLFNCAEQSQRFITEHKLRTQNFDALFFTQIDWDRLGGLSDLIMTGSSKPYPTHATAVLVCCYINTTHARTPQWPITARPRSVSMVLHRSITMCCPLRCSSTDHPSRLTCTRSSASPHARFGSMQGERVTATRASTFVLSFFGMRGIAGRGRRRRRRKRKRTARSGRRWMNRAASTRASLLRSMLGGSCVPCGPS